MNNGEHILKKKNISLLNKETFNTVFNEYYSPLVLFANSYVNYNQDDAEDIVQDVFIKLLQKDYAFNTLSSLKAYLYKSVKNSCLNYIKHEKVVKNYADKEKSIPTTNANFFDRIIEEEVYYHMVKALESLPKRCKEVFLLSLNGLKNTEIASEMNITVETVKSQKKRGKKILTKLLKPHIMQLFLLIVKN